jgi:hypothetical protein
MSSIFQRLATRRVLAAALAMCLAACGGGGGGEASPSASNTGAGQAERVVRFSGQTCAVFQRHGFECDRRHDPHWWLGESTALRAGSIPLTGGQNMDSGPR